MELLTTRTGRGPGRYISICQQMHTTKGYIMLRVLLCFMLLATWPGQAARGAVPGSPPGPAPPQNRAPQTVSYIDVGTLYVGGSSATVNASSYFSDPDGDTLTYSVNSPSSSIATVSISGSTVTVAPVAVGTTGKIIVTATDPDGLTATQDFTATVENPPPPPPPANRAPVAVGSISDVSLSKGGSSATRSLSGKFSDPDNDTLRYSVNSPSPSIATVSISGSTVTISPVSTGSTGKIIVTARDPDGLTATQDFTATVANQPPRAVGNISDVTLYKNGKTRRIPVSSKFSDPNGDTLTYSASSDKTSVATVSVSGSTVTVRSGAKGTATITVTAEDTDDATGTQDFDVTVINRIPQPQGNISKMTFHRGQAAKSTDVSDNFRDPDNDVLTFTASSSNTSVATVSVSGSDVEVDPGVLGSARITVTATDTDNVSNRHGFNVEVVNRPPVVSQSISDRSLNKNSSDSFNASSHFSDPDGDQMTFSARSSNTVIAGVSVSGNTVTIESEGDGGDATVTVTATDVHNASVSTDFTVTVRNRSPQGNGSIDAVTLYKNRHTQDVIVSGKFTDPDGDALTYSASSSNTAVATASVSGDTVTITSGNSGSATITVKAEDFDKASATQSISVSVMNRAPEIVVSIADVNIRVGDPSESFDVSGNFSDPDGGSLTFSVDDPDSSVAKVSISGSEVTVAPKSEGEIGKVTVTATDTEDDSISEDFRVVVGPEETTPPSCPSANTVAIMVPALSAGGDSVTMDVSDYFEIPQGVTPTYEANNPDSTIADVSISGHTLTIEPKTQGYTGKVIVTVSAAECTDVTRDFNVTVDPVPPIAECPAVKQMHPSRDVSMIIGGSDVEVNLNSHFTNLDKSNIEYTIVSSNADVATASRTDSTLAISPGIAGNAQVTVTVSRVGCGTGASQVFNVRVETLPTLPMAASVTVSPSEATVEEGEMQQFSATASDSDNMEIPGKTFTWTSSDTAVATISTAGLATALDAGPTTITAAVDNVSGTATLTVTEPPPPATCPALVGSIEDQTLTVGGDTARIDLTQYFSLPAEFVPNYEVNSTDATVTTTSLASDILTVTPAAAGTDTVSVTVSNQDCDPVTQSFAVAVSLPCPAEITDAPIQDQTLFAGAGITRIDLTGHFEHIGQEGIEITVTSPSPQIAVLSTEDSILKIDPKSAGQIATVAVTVTDTARSAACTPVSLSFMITVMDPLSTPWSVSGENVYRLTGNVGIGVSSPDQKLVVDGKIKAEEVYVPMMPADYVFEAGHDLMPLEDVARHIRDHGHLPGVASGAEMKVNGISISQMQTLLLEKIEEFSLYVIGQHEQLRAQGHSIDAQQQRLKLQNQRIRQLGHRLERLEQRR